MSIDLEVHRPSVRKLSTFRFATPGMAIVAVAMSLVGGCSRPTETARNNRRLFDAILTAVTIRNRDELLKDKKLLDARLDNAQLSAESHATITHAVDKAAGGDWSAAEAELYKFREQDPFPK